MKLWKLLIAQRSSKDLVEPNDALTTEMRLFSQRCLAIHIASLVPKPTRREMPIVKLMLMALALFGLGFWVGLGWPHV